MDSFFVPGSVSQSLCGKKSRPHRVRSRTTEKGTNRGVQRLKELPGVRDDKETRLNKATTFAFSSSRLKRTSFTSISSSSTIKCSTIQDLHSSRLIQVPISRSSSVQVPFLSNKVYCSRTLSGYWVGPDSEDGWGFVQALVDEII